MRDRPVCFALPSQGLLSYWDIARNYAVAGSGYTRHWNDVSKVPWLSKDDGSEFISYDDPESIGLKVTSRLRSSEHTHTRTARGLHGRRPWRAGSSMHTDAFTDAIRAVCACVLTGGLRLREGPRRRHVVGGV